MTRIYKTLSINDVSTSWLYLSVNGFGPEWTPLSIKDSNYISQQLRKVGILKQGNADMGVYSCAYRTDSGDRLIFASTHEETEFYDLINWHMKRAKDFNVFEKETPKEILERELEELLSKVIE